MSLIEKQDNFPKRVGDGDPDFNEFPNVLTYKDCLDDCDNIGDNLRDYFWEDKVDQEDDYKD